MADGSWEIAHVLFAEADKGTGAITAQLGDVVSGEVYESNAPVFQAWGYLALPASPVAGVSAPEAVVLKHPAGDIVIGGRSVRSAAIAGLVKPGESCTFADGSEATTLYKLDGSVTIFTTHDNTSNGRSIYYRVAPDRGFDEAWPWGRRFFDKSGHHFVHVSGAQFHLGSVNAPAPLNAFGSYFTLTASMGQLNASFVTIGPAGAVYSPVARADATLAAFQAIQSAVSALSHVVALIAGTPAAVGVAPSANPLIGVPPNPGALQVALVAVSAAVGAIAAATVGTVPVPGPIGSKSLAAA